MDKFLKCELLKCMAALFVLLTVTEAFARGAASSIMNSPGYQRRLQESRGYVPNNSGLIHQAQPSRAHHVPKRRHHH